MLRFMLYMPNRQELNFFSRPSYTKAIKDAKAVQKVLREEGYDVRMNMQTYKLSYQGELSYD